MMSPPKAPSKTNSTRRPNATFSTVSKARTIARAPTLDTMPGCVPFHFSSAVPEQPCDSTGDIGFARSSGCALSQKVLFQGPLFSSYARTIDVVCGKL